MRKHIREMMRREAERKNYKPSKAVHELWLRFQEKKQSSHQKVLANQARGTRPKRKWKQAYERVFG